MKTATVVLSSLVCAGCGTSRPEYRAARGDIARRRLDIGEEVLMHALGGDDTTQLWQGHDPDTTLRGERDVGAILAADGSVHCTATAISSTVVITAAHCFASTLCGGQPNLAYHDTLRFVQGAKIDAPTFASKIAASVCFSANPCEDVALARLEIPLPFEPKGDLTIKEPDPSVVVEKLGYGAFLRQDHPSGNGLNAGKLAQTEVWISHDNVATYQYTGVSPGGEPVEICEGDSGGPGIQGDGNLIGLTSSSNGTSNAPTDKHCNPDASDTRLAAPAYKEWIDKTRDTMGSAHGNQCQ